MTYHSGFCSIFLFFNYLLFGPLATAQEKPSDYATIYLYKPKAALSGIMRHTVKINGQEVGWLRNGSKIRYKIYSTGPVSIDLDTYIYLLGTAQRDHGNDIHTQIDVEPGGRYYMRVQFNIDGSGQGFYFVNEQLGRYEYNKRSLFKSSYPEIVKEEDISAYYSKNDEETTDYPKPTNYSNLTARQQVKKYVEKHINEWQQRGRYEKSEDYYRRVNERSRAIKIQELTDEATHRFAMERLVTEGAMVDYDPDNETFRIKMEGFSPFYLNVPIGEAPAFDQNVQQIEFTDEIFTLAGEDEFAFLSVKVSNPVNGQSYVYNNNEDISYNPAGLDLEFENVDVDMPEYKKTTISKGTQITFISDVDINIPKTNTVNEDAIAVVIGNKDYENRDVPTVDFALNDASIMKEYLISTFGFNEANILYIENARQADFYRIFGTKGNHKARLHNLVKPDRSDVFIFYSGHGAPDPESKEGYFVPVNCDPSLVAFNGYPINTFYENLSQIPYRSLTVVLDACFSGSSEGGMLIKNVSPIFIEPKIRILNDENARIFTSAGGDQVSSWYTEQNHSLFTYFFLKGIQGAADADKDNRLALRELRNYIEEHVPYEARRLNNRIQTPEVYGNDEVELVRY